MTPCMNITALSQRVTQPADNSQTLLNLFRQSDLRTPALVLSRSQISTNYHALRHALPRVSIHYAVKPNIHPVIIDELYHNGSNFDVCSAGEVNEVLKTGIDPATLIHSHPIKSRDEFDKAVSAGIELFVVDNAEEIKKLKHYTNKKLKVLIRYRIKTNTQAVVNLQYKFGCTTDEVLTLAKQIEQTGHQFFGLCFHIGSQCVNNENYIEAIETAHKLIQMLDMEGLNVQLLDIGGGFPIQYIEPVPQIDEFCKPIAEALDRHIRPGIKVISEPGRFISATSVNLITTIVGKSYRDGKIWYYLDDGLYSTFSGIVFDKCQYPVVTANNGEEKLSVLAGPTCDSFDVMYDGLMIPEHNVGDRIMFMATGAYCEVSGSNFNALPRPKYIVID